MGTRALGKGPVAMLGASFSTASTQNQLIKTLLQDKENGFGWARHNPLPPKPRKVGVTEIRGPYYSVSPSFEFRSTVCREQVDRAEMYHLMSLEKFVMHRVVIVYVLSYSRLGYSQAMGKRYLSDVLETYVSSEEQVWKLR